MWVCGCVCVCLGVCVWVCVCEGGQRTIIGLGYLSVACEDLLDFLLVMLS